jgi:ribosomal protein L40E
MDQVCCVCHEALDGENVSRCRLCGGSFHMAWSTGGNIKECGTYWFHPEHCGLNFICRLCEAKLGTGGAQSPSQFATS